MQQQQQPDTTFIRQLAFVLSDGPATVKLKSEDGGPPVVYITGTGPHNYVVTLPGVMCFPLLTHVQQFDSMKLARIANAKPKVAKVAAVVRGGRRRA
jgi:hypothetical protein